MAGKIVTKCQRQPVIKCWVAVILGRHRTAQCFIGGEIDLSLLLFIAGPIKRAMRRGQRDREGEGETGQRRQQTIRRHSIETIINKFNSLGGNVWARGCHIDWPLIKRRQCAHWMGLPALWFHSKPIMDPRGGFVWVCVCASHVKTEWIEKKIQR